MNPIKLVIHNMTLILVLMLNGIEPAWAMTAQELKNYLESTDPVDDLIGTGYLIGVTEGFDEGMMIGLLLVGKDDFKEYRALRARYLCVPKGISAGQISAVVKKYLQNNPEQWHRPASSLVFEGMREAWPCKQKDTK